MASDTQGTLGQGAFRRPFGGNFRAHAEAGCSYHHAHSAKIAQPGPKVFLPFSAREAQQAEVQATSRTHVDHRRSPYLHIRSRGGGGRTSRLASLNKVLTEQGKGVFFLVAAGFVNKDLEFAKFRLDVVEGQKIRARRQDGCLDDRMLGPVEAKEITHPALVHDDRFDFTALLAVVNGSGAELIVPATISQHP